MPLSEREQRLLSQMEEQLLSDDPRFASTMRGSGARNGLGKRLVIGGGGIVGGVALLLVSVSTQQVLLGVLAFAVMVAGAAYAIGQGGTAKGPVGVDAQGRRQAPPKRNKNKQTSSLVQRMEMRWQERRGRGDI